MSSSASAALAALQMNPEDLRRIAEAIPGVAWITAADGSSQYVNSRGREGGGLISERIAGDEWAQGVHPDDLDMCLRAWREAVGSGVPFAIEVQRLRGDGAYRRSLLRALPLRDADGRVAAWIGTEIEIETGDRAGGGVFVSATTLAEPAQDPTGALERSLVTVCHDLRTPISAMVGWLHLMQSGKLDEAGMTRAMEKLQVNLAEQVQILDRVIDLLGAGME